MRPTIARRSNKNKRRKSNEKGDGFDAGGIGVDARVVVPSQVLREECVVRSAVVLDGEVAKCRALSGIDGKANIAEQSERQVVASRAHGVQIDRVRTSAPTSEAASPAAASSLPSTAEERFVPVDREADSPKGAAESDDVFRVLIDVVDEVGVGGDVDWKRGYITTSPYQQIYDLQEIWGDVSESCNRIEVKRIFHERQPAFARIYDPFSMTGMSYSNIFNELGFCAYSPAVQFLMTPIFEDLLRGQAIEFNDMVRKSQYSFEIINNKLKLFPIPTETFKVYFQYIVENDRYNAATISGSNIVSDYSNIPYENLNYGQINEVGKQWIRKYFLACCKETLGLVRQKYQNIPIPGGEVTLDGAELRQESQQEKEALIQELRENLEAAGRKQQIEDRAKEAEYINETLRRVPTLIYIG